MVDVNELLDEFFEIDASSYYWTSEDEIVYALPIVEGLQKAGVRKVIRGLLAARGCRRCKGKASTGEKVWGYLGVKPRD